ncbi:hypothetical protein [Bradyrhizobium zhanjiangense]|uniref:hypothetical protein n=1 Tax=Bradyrhizobium zhanjiangense TaxID=1325107 RepID=UPI0010091488|nr:hypothetical protein [Bradyrhizobium zhanjiangense]
MNSGHDWTDRLERLAEHAPDLNIFSAKFVSCDALGWEITQDGRQFLCALEKAVALKESGPDQPSIPRPAKSLSKRSRMRKISYFPAQSPSEPAATPQKRRIRSMSGVKQGCLDCHPDRVRGAHRT